MPETPLKLGQIFFPQNTGVIAKKFFLLVIDYFTPHNEGQWSRA